MYTELRQIQQLGYFVGCSKKKTCGINGVSLVIQSADYSPIHLEEKILEWIREFKEIHMSDDSPLFQNYKKGILNRLKAGH